MRNVAVIAYADNQLIGKSAAAVLKQIFPLKNGERRDGSLCTYKIQYTADAAW